VISIPVTLIDLKASIESVVDGAAVIASAAEGAMASVDETSTAVNEISVAIEEVSRNLDTLAGIVHQSAAAMEADYPQYYQC
jgi:methyl-accepting chemotaxis protein